MYYFINKCKFYQKLKYHSNSMSLKCDDMLRIIPFMHHIFTVTLEQYFNLIFS